MGLMENGNLRMENRPASEGVFSAIWQYRFPFSIFLLLTIGCSPSHKELVDSIVLQAAPEFQADSAYAHIAAQVAFGPRIPGTDTHAQCADFLVAKLSAYGAEVVEQHDSATVAGGRRLPIRNIIGSFNAERGERLLLVAHYDSRHITDQDADHHDEPLIGAHDGASGVAVLLEVARLVGQTAPEIGVDIIFFDVEDQGRPWEEGDTYDSEFFFCMGSRHWARNPHIEGYKARYGILVDMVAAKDAVFTLEQVSMQHAPEQMRYVWAVAHRLGHRKYFRFNLTRGVLHDHFFINTLTDIPCLSIIDHDNSSATGFGRYWHTRQDDITTIDRTTLKAVGQTLVQVVYNEGR
jgi:hypothetical protein